MRPLKILLVEDSAVLRETLIEALEEMAPVRVVATAADETEAMQKLREHTVDLAIIDVFLKTGSGLAVLAAAKTMGHKATLIVFSNFTNATMRARCVELGAARVFDKSNDIDELIAYCIELGAAEPAVRR
jgi:DNA-binding NarL/FixJ family response regulator